MSALNIRYKPDLDRFTCFGSPLEIKPLPTPSSCNSSKIFLILRSMMSLKDQTCELSLESALYQSRFCTEQRCVRTLQLTSEASVLHGKQRTSAKPESWRPRSGGSALNEL